VLSGAHVVYLDSYPLDPFSMYGAVPLREIKRKLLDLKRAGKLDRVRMLSPAVCANGSPPPTTAPTTRPGGPNSTSSIPTTTRPGSIDVYCPTPRSPRSASMPANRPTRR